jgi:Na+-driven multidrug efflux pump
MQSTSAFVAQNVGAGKEKRARQAMVNGMVMGVCLGIVIATFSFFKGNILAGIFTNDEQVIIKAAEYLKGFSMEAIVTSILFSFVGYFNGHGQTLFVMCQGLAQTFVVRLPMSYFMSVKPNATLTGIGLAAPSATVFGIIINVIFYIIFTKKQRKEI